MKENRVSTMKGTNRIDEGFLKVDGDAMKFNVGLMRDAPRTTPS